MGVRVLVDCVLRSSDYEVYDDVFLVDDGRGKAHGTMQPRPTITIIIRCAFAIGFMVMVVYSVGLFWVPLDIQTKRHTRGENM